MTKGVSIKSSPQICYTNLRPLKKPNTFPILEARNVIEAGEIIGKNVDQGRSGMVGFCNAVREAALVLLHPTISDRKLVLQTRLVTPHREFGQLLASNPSFPGIGGSLPPSRS